MHRWWRCATVALALLTYELAGAVLSTALALKMIAHVVLGPIASAWIPLQHRKKALITLDLARAGVAALLPLVTETWQVYVLIFVLQSASAGFTPLFQSLIPAVLPDERDYTTTANLPTLFAAQFALSHACWLLAYPLAGWVGATFGLGAAFGSLAALAIIGAMVARHV